MQSETGAIQPKLHAWFAKAKTWLIPYRPRVKDRNFWIIQCLITAIVALHILIELDVILPGLQSSDFVPSTLFLLPLAYAALTYGLAGSVGTAVWATIMTMPNLVILHHGLPLMGEILQLLTVNAAAVFLGYWVERERTASKRAKAHASHVLDAQEEERQRIARRAS